MKHCPYCHCKLPEQDYTKQLRGKSAQRCLSVMRLSPHGLTDDEMDVITNMKHQTTTPSMRALRWAGLIEWRKDKDGQWITRATRKGCQAKVNFLKHQPIELCSTSKPHSSGSARRGSAAAGECGSLRSARGSGSRPSRGRSRRWS